MLNMDNMTVDELKEALTDVINDRESYPEDSTSKKAIALDELYLDLDTRINTLSEVIEYIRMYIMDDTVRKENFTDIEICCADDNDDANEELKEILNGYSWNDCKAYLLKEAESDLALKLERRGLMIAG